MPQGAAWPNGGNLALWHANFKINTEKKGFNLKFNIADKVEADAKVAALDLAGRVKALLTEDAEIFYATLSRDDHKKDSRYLHTAIGAGTYNIVAPPGDPTTYDNAPTALLFRLEMTDGSEVTRKFAPLPDPAVLGGNLVAAIAPIIGTPGAAPAAPAGGDTFAERFNKFMGAVLFYTHAIESGHTPGGVYNYQAYINAFALRVGVKKGGRVFTS